jgi:hypothetical protein
MRFSSFSALSDSGFFLVSVHTAKAIISIFELKQEYDSRIRYDQWLS